MSYLSAAQKTAASVRWWISPESVNIYPSTIGYWLDRSGNNYNLNTVLTSSPQYVAPFGGQSGGAVLFDGLHEARNNGRGVTQVSVHYQPDVAFALSEAGDDCR